MVTSRIRMRRFAGAGDLPLIADLIDASSPLTPHRIDFPWRLSSPALQGGHDARLLEDRKGELVGFATWQPFWAVLDCYFRSGPWQAEVEDAAFGWAKRRFRELDKARGEALPYWVEVRLEHTERVALLERHGFTLNEDYSYRALRRSLTDPIPPSEPPPGFVIRPLAGDAEVTAYVDLHCAVFASNSMTTNWRRRALLSPQYAPGLDLVAVAPSGELAGFCVAWLGQERQVCQIEPFGVKARYRQIGLGRSLLLDCFHRLYARGATSAVVETESTRAVALKAYESVGFQFDHEVQRKGTWM